MRYLPQIEAGSYALLKNEAFAHDVKWERASGLFADWKAGVGPWVREAWPHLDRHIKIAIAMDAYLRARDELETVLEQQASA